MQNSAKKTSLNLFNPRFFLGFCSQKKHTEAKKRVYFLHHKGYLNNVCWNKSKHL